MVKKLKDITAYEVYKICDECPCCSGCPLAMYVTNDGKVFDEPTDETHTWCLHDDIGELIEHNLLNYEVDIPEDSDEATTEVQYSTGGTITW